MKKLVRTLSKLEPQELQRLNRYLRDPYTRPHADTLQLFEYLQPHHPNFIEVSFEDYYNQFHKGKRDKSEFRLRCSYLLNKVHRFLAREELENDPDLVKLGLIRSLIRRREYNEADRQLRLAIHSRSDQSQLGSDNYYHNTQLHESVLELSFSQKMQTSHQAIENYFEVLDQLYVGLQMKYLLPALTYHRVFGKDFPQDRWNFCRGRMEAWGELAPPLARISYHLLHLFHEEPQYHYKKVSLLVETHAHRMPVNERLNVYGYIQNYLTQQQSQGEDGTLQGLFDLYQRMDSEGLIFGSGDYTEHLVRNTIITSCRLGELAWARDFLAKNRTLITESAGENVFAYVSAFHHFYAGEYSPALRTLQQVRFSSTNYRTGHQTLLLRIYFELNDIESIEGVAATFRRYLNRSRHLSDRQKDLNRNFISVVLLLARAREEGFNSYRRKRIEQILNSAKELTDRTWLSEKYREVLESK